MESAVFSIFRFGLYDSGDQTQPKRESMAAYYELEFYGEDCPGGRRIDGQLYLAREGYCTLAKPGQMVQMLRPYKCSFLNIGTRDPELCSLLDQLPTSFPLWNLEQVLRLIREMAALEGTQNLPYRMQLQGYVCRILALLSQHRLSGQPVTQKVLLHQKTLLEADAYMRQHLAEAICLEDLARRCNLDPTYFHKLFTAAYGMTPAKKLLNYRIIEARRGLLAEDVPLQELAARCGFSSQAYFCYKFKQVTGKTPLQYRKEMLTHL